MEEYLREQNRQQREIITQLEETIKALKKQYSETIMSLRNEFAEISNIGHSNDIHKNMKMLKIADRTINELDEDIKIELADRESTNSKK